MLPGNGKQLVSGETVESRLRRFLLLTALVLLATLAELVLEEHTEEALQMLPFALCGAGLLAVAAAFLSPQRATLLGLRVVMLVVGIGGLVGIGVHLYNNFEFEQEIRPNASALEAFMDAIKGAAPLLAPGTLIFAALLAAAATYDHPELRERGQR